MTILPSSHPIVIPSIRTRSQLEAVLENIAALRRERSELERAQESEIATVRQKFRTPLAEVERFLTLESTWAENWARANPEALGPGRALTCAHGTVGFRQVEPRVDRASRRWNWWEIVERLGESNWGQRYLRTAAPDIDREAILRDRAQITPDALRQVGMKIVEGEKFFISPAGEADGDKKEEWEEAA